MSQLLKYKNNISTVKIILEKKNINKKISRTALYSLLIYVYLYLHKI